MSNLSPAIQRFIELERRKADVKKYFDELSQALEAVVAEVGVNTYFQDPTDGCVYKTTTPEGRFVHYEKFGYARTRRADEKRGDLSLKEAQEAGFEV
jgi:hypothetical protein